MLNRERQQDILSFLRTQGGFVTVRALCDRFYASESSIRRDLRALEDDGMVRRAYGGAEATGFGGVSAFGRRVRQNEAEKRDIAKKAAALVHDGDVIFLDQSSTAFYLAGELSRRSLTIFTNSLEILMLLSDSSVRVFSSGGYLSERNRACLVGGDACASFRGVRATAAFFSTGALSDDGFILDYDREEVLVREAMLSSAARRVFLCDSSKFGGSAPYVQCALSSVEYMICEGESAQRFKEVCGGAVLV